MEEFDNYFKDKLADADSTPPADGWAAVSKVLDAANRRKRRPYAWIFLIGLSLVTSEIRVGNSTGETISIKSNDAETIQLDDHVISPVEHNNCGDTPPALQIEQQLDFRSNTRSNNAMHMEQTVALGEQANLELKMPVRSDISAFFHSNEIENLVTVQSDYSIHQGHTSDSTQSIAEKNQNPTEPLVEEKRVANGRFSKWTVTPSAGLSYVMKKIDPAEDIYYFTKFNNKNQASLQNVSFQFDTKFRRQVNQRTTLILGLSINAIRETTHYSYLNVIADSVEIKHVGENSIEVNTFFNKRANVLENTMVYNGVSIGVVREIKILQTSHNFFLEMKATQKVFHRIQTQDDHHILNTKQNPIFVKGGVEKTYRLNERISLSTMPFVQYSLGSLYDDNSVYSLRSLQIGVDVGLVFIKKKP